MESSEIIREKIIRVLPEPKNHAELLLQVFHRSHLQNVQPRSESMCKKCLTQWTAGQFTLKVQSSNHRRKRRRQYRIEKLRKLLKAAVKTSEITKLKRQVEHLQEQSNHVAIYNCEVCKHSTRVQCWKPKVKQDINESVTAASEVIQKSETVIKPLQKKNKGKKKKKTAGLILPPKNMAAPSTPSVTLHKQLSIAKLSNMFQQPTKSQMSSLNQFLK